MSQITPVIVPNPDMASINSSITTNGKQFSSFPTNVSIFSTRLLAFPINTSDLLSVWNSQY